MRTLIRKFLFVLVSLKYPHIKKDYRYFIRDNYFSRLNQIRFLFKDYFSKKKYKVIDFNGEFQQELTFVIPFAYWHYLNGTLKETISSKDSTPLYFFSKNHQEKYTERIWENNFANYSIPNMNHSISFSYRKWAAVPFKKQYANSLFVFEKPTLVIANKYNIEWGQSPINFFDIPTLDRIINDLKDAYQIIYNRPLQSQIVSDNSDILDLNEYEWLQTNHPEVILMRDLYKSYTDKFSFNHFQLLVYANCQRFISVHGGTAALASYFGGTNIILSRRGVEHELKEFETIFPRLSGAKILHATAEEELFDFVNRYYLPATLSYAN